LGSYQLPKMFNKNKSSAFKNIGVPFTEIMMVFAVVVHMEWSNSKCWWLSWKI